MNPTSAPDAVTASAKPATKPDLPDRLSIDPRSPFHNKAVFEHEVGIRFNGIDRNDVEEYCLSEAWVKVASTKAKDRRGQPLLMKLKGKLEVFYRPE